MTTVAFLVDAPDTLTLAAGVATSRSQVAKTGKFKDPRYGNFSITHADFQKWIKNFSTLSIADGRAGLPVDVDHGPEKTGNTEAAGWITKLDTMGKDGKTPTANELWATVEWNTLGQELIRDRRYLYLSPSYQHDYADESGKTHGTALVGVGLTNRPFLTMATVSLSRSFAVEDGPVEDVTTALSEADSQSTMSDLLKDLREKFQLSADADEAAILAAASAAVDKPTTSNATPGDINLSEAAKAQGMVVLSAADHLKLAADASAGAAAAKELHQSKFDTAWDDAVEGLAVVPAMKDSFELSYNADPALTIKTLSELPRRERSRGYTGDVTDNRTQANALARADANVEDWDIDNDRAQLDSKARELMAADATLSYDAACERVLSEV